MVPERHHLSRLAWQSTLVVGQACLELPGCLMSLTALALHHHMCASTPNSRRIWLTIRHTPTNQRSSPRLLNRHPPLFQCPYSTTVHPQYRIMQMTHVMQQMREKWTRAVRDMGYQEAQMSHPNQSKLAILFR